MDANRPKKPESHLRLARERIERFFRAAEREFSSDPGLSDRYVRLAWSMALKYNTGIPQKFKRKFCRKCLKYLVPGKTASVRVVRGALVVGCLGCGNKARYPVKKRKVLK